VFPAPLATPVAGAASRSGTVMVPASLLFQLFRMFRKLLLFSFLLLASLTVWAHTYHASILDVRYNPAKQQLEIALKVFTDDLEKTLSVGQPTPISLDQAPKLLVTQLATALLRKSLVFSTKPGESLPVQLLGVQKERDAHWLYCTVKLARPLTAFSLRNTLLLDQFPDQMNIVNLEAGGKKQSQLFRDGEETQKFSW
jgi:hypothetical protein